MGNNKRMCSRCGAVIFYGSVCPCRKYQYGRHVKIEVVNPGAFSQRHGKTMN